MIRRAEMILSIVTFCACTWSVPVQADPLAVKAVLASEIIDDPASICQADLDLHVCQVYVEFSEPEDTLLSVAFSDICALTPDGVFFQVDPVQGGGDTAPAEALLGAFPTLICDSFVTVGLKTIPLGLSDCTNLDPDFDTAEFNFNGHVMGGWFCSNPSTGQGLAGNYPDNQVLIGQFSVPGGGDVSGRVTAYYNDGTVPFEGSFICFEPEWTCQAEPAICDDGRICTVDACEPALADDCHGCVHRTVDFNGTGAVNVADLSILLGAWGPNEGHAADLDGDGLVGPGDLSLLLATWGPCD